MSVQAQAGPDLEEVPQEGIGFLALAGETKLRLVPTPWPSDSMPSPTSSLMSIAQREGLLAVAGPDCLVITSTASLRQAFIKDVPSDNNIKDFQPDLRIQVPRVSQVAFSSDEKYLVICAEEGGGMAVYEVDQIKQGNTQSAFQIATNGIKIRALVPNPAEETANFMALVLANGQLMLANMATREFISGVNGLVLKDGVSCASWSNKGKQIVAGLANGTGFQMKPDGSPVAEIPRAPQLQGDCHVSAISWMHNETWLFIYNPTNSPTDSAPESLYLLVNREPKTANYAFQKLPDPCTPFGLNRSPPHHFVARLRDYAPALTDLLVVLSTASADIGMFANSASPLSSDPTASNTAGRYVMASMANDAMRASLPMIEMEDTSPVGVVLDLSSNDPVQRPIPSGEIQASATPLPGLVVLNNRGAVSYWWLVYADSVRNKQPYPGMVAVASSQPSQQRTQASPASPFGAFANSGNAFGSPTTAISPSLARPSHPTFGSPVAPSFGQATNLGAQKSAWNAVSVNPGAASGSPGTTFSKPTFGLTSSLGSGAAFGSTGGLGQNKSPWTTAGNDTVASAAPAASPFTNASTASPFASMAKQESPFSIVAKNDKEETSTGLFGSVKQEPTAATGIGADGKPFSPFSSASEPSGFAKLAQPSSASSIFGQPARLAPSTEKESSFGSTVTWGSNTSLGTTPASLSNNTSGLSGQAERMSSSEADMMTDDIETKVETTPKKGDSFFGPSFEASLSQIKEKKEPLVASPEPKDTIDPIQTSAAEVEKDGDLVKIKEEVIEEAPLPPSPKLEHYQNEPDPTPLPTSPGPLSAIKDEEEEHARAASPPVDLGSSPLSDAESNDDAVKAEEAPLPPDFLPKATWGAGEKSQSPPRSPEITSPISIPAATPAVAVAESVSNTPQASATKPPMFFAPPTAIQQSPRSPSPIRRARQTTGQRSLSSPSPPRVRQASHQQMPPPSQLNTVVPLSSQAFPPPRVRETPKQAQFEFEDYDDDFDRNREELANGQVVATKRLAPFLTHQDYVDKVGGKGLGVQVERVYRDVSSMIDTLGLNGRSLAAFVKGQSELLPAKGQRERDDLTNDQDWCLGEIEDLDVIQKELDAKLDVERPQEIQERIQESQVMMIELNKLRARHHDLQLTIHRYQNPDTQTESKSLTADQSMTLLNLRKQFAAFQQLLINAEEGISLLQAKLVSVQNQATAGSSGAVPTVEAVVNTIAKMTRMVEQKSADLDILRAQMKLQRGRGHRHTPQKSLDQALGALTLVQEKEDGELFRTPPSSRRQNGYALDFSDSDEQEEFSEVDQTGHSDKFTKLLEDDISARGRWDRVERLKARNEKRSQMAALIKQRLVNRGPQLTKGY